MKGFSRSLISLMVSTTLCLAVSNSFAGANQTDDLSPVLSGSALPFEVSIQLANFQLPAGLQSFAMGVYKGHWIIIAGRINGLHGFFGDAFPPDQQNTSIYVINPLTGSVVSRSLNDASSGLSQEQKDSLSVTSPESYQEMTTLYLAGGYGIDTNRGVYTTKPLLTAINLPGIFAWVMEPANKNHSVVKNIRQISNPIFQVTGGNMYKLGQLTQLVFGQNMVGAYTSGSNGEYTQQVRRFKITNSNGQFSVRIYPSTPAIPDPNYRRRDLNVVPVITNNNNLLQYGLVAYAGVFTLAAGIWTVPVTIDGINDPVMGNPLLPSTFKQSMNHYACANAGLYSKKYNSMYNVFFGGISYGYYDSGTFQTDAEIPFINQVTTVQMDKNGHFTQYLMDAEYPVIISTGTNPGNQLIFGAGARFVPENVQQYSNGVMNLDSIRQPTVIGHIVGGIQSTVPNTSTNADSSASPYVFTVTLTPVKR